MKTIIFAIAIITLSVSYGIISCNKISKSNNSVNNSPYYFTDTSEKSTGVDTSSSGIIFPFMEDSIKTLHGLKTTYTSAYFITMPVAGDQGKKNESCVA